MHTRVATHPLIKAASLFAHAARHPRWTVRSLGRLYDDMCVNRGRIPTLDIGRLLPPQGHISLTNLTHEDGNMTTAEVVALVGLVRLAGPMTLLEIGTFNGNTTAQLAANSPPQSVVYTLDLPVGATADPRTELNDAHYVTSTRRQRPRYLDGPDAAKVVQVYGNSMEVDFLEVCDGRRPDLVFIDGGHSEACVRSDTQSALAALDPGGLIVWHDYTTAWPGVVNFLDELAGRLALRRVAGTTLVLHDASGKRFGRDDQA